MREKNKLPKISVIIPCYNDGRYLPEAVRSVEKCDKDSYEIIIVDDGSSDEKTAEVLGSMEKRGHRVFRIKHKGQSAARNFGVKKAKYDYLLFLDADNKIIKDYIVKGLFVLEENPQIGVVFGDREEFGISNRTVVQKFDISETIFGNTIDTCALVRKKAFNDCGGFDENLSLWEDWEFFINIHEKGWKFYHIPKVMFFYRLKRKSVNLKAISKKERLNVLGYIYKKHYSLFIDNFEKKIFNLMPKIRETEFLQELKTELESEKKRVQEFNIEISNRDIQIDSLKNKIENIEKSSTWRILKKYQKFIDIILPSGSKIRNIYDAAIRFNQNVFSKEKKEKPDIEAVNNLRSLSFKKSILLITNRSLSGGSILYGKKWLLDNEIENNIIVMDYEKANKFRIYYKDRLIDIINLNNYHEFELLLRKYDISSIFVNQLAGISDLKLIDYVSRSGLAYRYHIHDFYCILHYPHLIDERGNYLMDDSGNFVIDQKRKEIFSNFVKNAEKVFVPSEDTFNLIKKVYPYVNLEINKSYEISRFLNIYDANKAKSKILEIGIIGSIGIHKGSRIVYDLARFIERENLPIKLKVIGVLQEENEGRIFKGLQIAGPYDKKNLQNILHNSNISLIIFPSIWPETFSYVCQEAVELGYPVLCFDIGSQVERIKGGKYGWKVDLKTGPSGIFKKIKELEKDRSLIIKKSNAIKKDFSDTVDIIMPVYNGFFHAKRAIQSIIKNSDIKCNFVIIDDCSTDKKVFDFLKNLKSYNDLVQIKIMRNKENIGFVKTVNKGLLDSKNHCIIVNSDIVVPENWLSRMIMPLKKDSAIASATPYSNSATICSFPEINKDNLIEESSVDRLDSVFEKMNLPYVEIPVGVGFCLLMNRNAINDIGYLDQDTFEKGYCEEVDWCLRAKKSGWKNIHLQNLFVHHFGRASFGSESVKLSEINNKKFLKKHPDYNLMLKEFLDKDPAKINRIKILKKIEKEN